MHPSALSNAAPGGLEGDGGDRDISKKKRTDNAII